ncbi:MAG: arginine--tRNA ligase [Dermatophilaceae bacterium]
MLGDVGAHLERLVADAVRVALDVEITPGQALVRPSNPERGGDYQCNAAMSLATRLGRPSREIGETIAAAIDPAGVIEAPTVGGPGFVNLRLRLDWLSTQMTGLIADDRIGVPAASTPERVVVDYSGPNVAKEMHVGHLRSTIIGDALVRLREFLGHEVIRRNHLGDWGTPFGMLIEHLVDEGWVAGAGSEHSISDLNGFYQKARTKFDTDAEFAARARRRVVALQGGDSSTLALWRMLVAESQRHFEMVYRALGVTLTAEDSYAESFYNPFLADTITELDGTGLVRESDGALCAFPDGFTGREGEPAPIIVRKSDGGYTYGTTDLAATRYWCRERDAAELLYVIGAPQRTHLAMVVATATDAGWLDENHRAVHVSFGSVLGADGRMLRTRSGGSVRLIELLDEAVERAATVIAERSEIDEADRATVARAVGIGAVKYADLSSAREKDYVFAWDRMLAMEGNTSVYLQYANARIRSILRRADAAGILAGSAITVREPAERALAIAVLRLPAAVAASDRGYAPHTLCGYLYEVATAFSGFYENCPILADTTSREERASRLALAALTSRALVLGLDLLGIEAPEKL